MVLSKISHISWRYLRNRGYPVGLHDGHNLALRGMHHLSRAPARKEPITTDLLRTIRSLCNLASAHNRVLWGPAVMGFFLMRQSEYLSESAATKPYIIKVRDVKIVDHRGSPAKTSDDAVAVHIRFRGSKTDQVGEGKTRVHAKSSSRWVCSVLAVWSLVDHCKTVGVSRDQPLCSTVQDTSLEGMNMSSIIKAAAAQLIWYQLNTTRIRFKVVEPPRFSRLSGSPRNQALWSLVIRCVRDLHTYGRQLLK